jgi:hypothetical protein
MLARPAVLIAAPAVLQSMPHANLVDWTFATGWARSVLIVFLAMPLVSALGGDVIGRINHNFSFGAGVLVVVKILPPDRWSTLMK